jgi:hypothetical protein
MIKTFLTTVLILISITVICKSEPYDMNTVYTSVYNTVAHDLGLDTIDVQITVSESFFSVNIPIGDNPCASTQKVNNHSYIVYIYCSMDKSELIKTLIHEFTHIKQMYTGRMQVTRKYILFDGVKITKDVPWNERPFEIEANDAETSLFNKYFL